MLSVSMVNVTYKPIVLSVVMLSVVRLNDLMLSVVAPQSWVRGKESRLGTVVEATLRVAPKG
jgi:hypothetical protein